MTFPDILTIALVILAFALLVSIGFAIYGLLKGDEE